MRWIKMPRTFKTVRALVCVGLTVLVVYTLVRSLMQVLALQVIEQPTNARDNADPRKQQEMMKIILLSGDFAPVPSRARIKVLKTEGNFFNRRFRLEFTANIKTIKEWMNRSRGMRTATLEKDGNIYHYTIIKPRSDFQRIEVSANFDVPDVAIYVSQD